MKFRIIAISIIVLCCIIMYFLYRTEIRSFFVRRKNKGLVRPDAKKRSGKKSKNKKAKAKKAKAVKAKSNEKNSRVVRKKIPNINMNEIQPDELNTGIGFSDDFTDNDDFYLDEPESPIDLDEAEKERQKRWDDDWL